jgi:hypothetical protein
MLFRMRGSVFLAILALPLGGCSMLLDWSDYTGGLAVDASTGVPDSSVAPVSDASVAPDVSSTVDARDVGQPDNEDVAVMTPPPADASSSCDLPACPTNTCNITVYYHSCCLPDGGCGCYTVFPTAGPCMATP